MKISENLAWGYLTDWMGRGREKMVGGNYSIHERRRIVFLS